MKVKNQALLLYILLNSLLFVFSLSALDVEPGVNAGTDFSKLSARADCIDLEILRFQENEYNGLYAYTDYHAVFDRNFEDLSNILTNFDIGGDIFPRIAEMKDLTPLRGQFEDRLQWVHATAKFLGIGQDYIYTCLVSFDQPGENEYIQQWTMIDREEGNLYTYEGFWYLKKLQSVDGAPRTYIRLYVESTFKHLIPLQELIMNMFSRSETVAVFNSVYKTAGR